MNNNGNAIDELAQQIAQAFAGFVATSNGATSNGAGDAKQASIFDDDDDDDDDVLPIEKMVWDLERGWLQPDEATKEVSGARSHRNPKLYRGDFVSVHGPVNGRDAARFRVRTRRTVVGTDKQIFFDDAETAIRVARFVELIFASIK